MNINYKMTLITSSFPYGNGEQFVKSEIAVLSKYFDIEVMPIYFGGSKSARALPNNVHFKKPIVGNHKIISALIGIFNCAPIIPLLLDFVRMLLKKNKLRISDIVNYLKESLLIRTMLSDKYIKKKILQGELMYFYWGGFPIGLIPNLNGNVFIRVHSSEADLILNNNFILLDKHKYIKNKNVTYLPISYSARNNILKISDVNYRISRLGVTPLTNNTEKQKSIGIRVVSASSLIPLKRVFLILKAIKKITDEIEWIHFGDGPLMKDMIRELDSIPSNVTVFLKGHVSNTEIHEFYSKNHVDLFINVSETEGVPVSIMEAMAYGIPVFATNVGGTGEIVTNESGYLVDKDFEISDLVNAIRDQKYNPQNAERKRMATCEIFKTKSDANANYTGLAAYMNNMVNKEIHSND